MPRWLIWRGASRIHLRAVPSGQVHRHCWQHGMRVVHTGVSLCTWILCTSAMVRAQEFNLPPSPTAII